jgi:protein-disulfide isomerase
MELQQTNMDSNRMAVMIVLGGVIAAVGVLLMGSLEKNRAGSQIAGLDTNGIDPSASAGNVRPVGEDDHVFGNKDAEVVIVEYSDFECPFCQRLHPTLTRIVEESEGEVAWVYRHFPITSIHSRALDASLASECIAEQAGNEAFWEFTRLLLADTQNLNEDFYLDEAKQFGILSKDFQACLDSRRHQGRVKADQENALAAGGSGTPFTVVINKKGEALSFAGALPYESVKQIVDAMGS